jgi:phosphatidylinositol glycan class P protein
MHENDLGPQQHKFHPGMPPEHRTALQHQNLEEENEKRQLESIYKVAGEDKKTHISSVELYGFFSWNLSAIVFIIYIIWAFVPAPVLQSFGIFYIPDQYYAIALPLWLAVTVVTVLQLYVAFCMFATPEIESYATLQDKHTILKNPVLESENQQFDQDRSSNSFDQRQNDSLKFMQQNNSLNQSEKQPQPKDDSVNLADASKHGGNSASPLKSTNQSHI